MNFGRIFLTSGLAFFIAIAIALLIEKLGGALGSIVGTVPTNLALTTFMILTETSMTFDEITESCLALVYGVFSTDLLFMPTWKVLPPKLPAEWKNGKKVLVTTLVSLILWFIGAVIMILAQTYFKSLGVSMWIISGLSLLFIIVYGMALCWSLPPTPTGKNKVKWYTHFFRGIAAFIALFICGVLSQSGLGIAAGAMGTFPTAFLTAMVSVSLSQRAEVATGAIGPLILGSISGATFAVYCAIGHGLIKLSAGWCVLFGFVMSCVTWSIPIYYYIKWRRDTTAAKKLKIQQSLKEVEVPEVTKDSPVSNETKVAVSNPTESPVGGIIPSNEK